MAKILKLNALKLNQPTKKDQSIFITSIKVKYLIDETYFKVNWWQREKMGSSDQGYQRIPLEGRKKKIVKYLENYSNPIFPTNILINSRSPLHFLSKNNDIGELVIDSYPCWIVDGQTRIEGFKLAIEELKLEEVLEYDMPITILSNFELYDELEQFFILNSTQKKVSTDLAQRLKLEIAKSDPKKYETLGIGEMWELRALKVVDLLNKKNDSYVWQGRIRLPNTQKSPINIINQNSFITSLKPLFKDGIMENFKPELAHEALKNYWDALKRFFPDAFLKPKEYVIQKTPGVFSLHSLANKIFQSLLHKKKDFTENNIKELLNKAFDGEQSTSDFWRRDGSGAALYGSMKGFMRLADSFKRNLPEIDDES